MGYQSTYEGAQVDEAVGRALPNGPMQTQMNVIEGKIASFHGLVIKGGPYEDLAALQQAVPNPQVGDSYSVGTSVPYDIYCWNGTEWVNYGDIGSVGAVRYDGPMSLTTGEKALARSNIGIQITEATQLNETLYLNGTLAVTNGILSIE